MGLFGKLFGKKDDVEEVAVETAAKSTEKAETQAKKGLEQSSISSNTENNSNNNLDLYYDPSTRKTIYGTIKNGIFFPSKGRPFPLSATWDSKNPTYYSKENLYNQEN